MTSPTKMNFDLEGIGTLLSNYDLAVPKYQRSFAWEKENVDDLFKDLNTAMRENRQEYFLGTLILSDKQQLIKRFEVVDGQQRLATTTILLAAIRDYLCSVPGANGNERASLLEREFLWKTDRSTLENTARLRLNIDDNPYFEQAVLFRPDNSKRDAAKAITESERRIMGARDTAAEYVQKLVSIDSDPINLLTRLQDYLEKNVKVMCIRVPDDANAFRIFETLNDRGIPLAISDLLKNFLFHMAEDRIEEVQQNWVSMTSVLDEELTVTFIRHYWSSVHDLTRDKELYEDIKKTIVNKQAASDLALELRRNSRLYAAILSESHEFWSEMDLSETERSYVGTLNLLRVERIRPLMLAVLDKFNKEQIKQCLRLFVSWTVRLLIHGGYGGTVEKRYAQHAVDVRLERLCTPEALIQVLQNLIPNDSEFQTSFQTTPVSKQYLARYYLRELEKQARYQRDPQQLPNKDPKAVNLEHILPERPNDLWPSFTNELAEAYVNRLGNMALLRGKHNSKIGNQGFLQKKEYFAKSDFILTKELANYDNWGPSQIDERQKHLAELAVKAWPNSLRA